jgi:hypothetical protein
VRAGTTAGSLSRRYPYSAIVLAGPSLWSVVADRLIGT